MHHIIPIISQITQRGLHRSLLLVASCMLTLSASAQITIGGNVYGGGNEGEIGIKEGEAGSTATTADMTNVTIHGGSITGSVFGGGRMANVNGGTNVNLDAALASDSIIIGKVFGGNDVSGVVSYTAVVHSTYDVGNEKKIWVDELYGGGNGEYDYASHLDGDSHETNPYAGLGAPNIENTSINLLSGCYGKVFGGGNSATVTGSTTITLNNSTSILKKMVRQNDGTVTETDLNYQFGSVFGGNNKVAMAIRPTWELTKGSIDNLYSGGNAGDMTHPQGILLAVKSADMTINNMFGGCRMADVNPDKNTFAAETLEGYEFPANHAARVFISAGKINNVYGGNDVSGNVYGGNALEIRSSIINDVYGGGNGSYNYTDKSSWVTAHPEDADYYYEIPAGKTSAEALYNHRPNAEAVNMHVTGTQASPTYIGGGLYCGGNSATLAKDGGDAVANLKIGSYVVAKNVFLGSNGENMVTTATLQKYADTNFSGLALTNTTNFEEYMRGCEVSIKPVVTFEDGYTDYSTKFESLYCGGNVGSMSAEGYFNLDFLQKLVIYQKLVGGCNNANVAASTYNAAHEGGLTYENTPIKVQLNVAGVEFEPKTISYDGVNNLFSVGESKENGLYKGGNIYGGCYQSGYINGGVQINISQSAIQPDVKSALDASSGAYLAQHRDEVFNTALSAFGGGYGEETEIKGSTEINLSSTANIIKVFGGGEKGVVNGNTVINQTAGNVGAIYGGGFEGLVKGNTAVNLDGGTVHFAFGGACNADINGYAEMFIGANGTPTITDEIFGGNDFGGQIKGTGLHDAYGTDKVKSNTYVLYKDGTVTNGIYGGSYGSYDYTTAPYLAKAQESGFAFPSFTTAVADDGTAQIYANSYVDIATASQTAVAGGNIYGGGYGYLNIKGNAALQTAGLGTDGQQLPIVDMKNTYVLLRSTNANTNVAHEILGGGYYSVVENTRVDARSGLTTNLYGGTYGATAATSVDPHMDPAVNYRSQNTIVNVYDGENASSMNVFGGGANAGSVATNVNLYGGTVNNVYGGSNMEGVVVTANVAVPDASTSVTNAIFGGGYGSDINLPCDVLTANVNWASNTAYVADGVIYGGNNAKRATKTTNITISKPVKKSASGEYASICGGGNGENTVTGYTHVTLANGAHVKNVYGGGRDGKVYGYYDDKVKATAYYDEANYDRNVYAHWAYTAAVSDPSWNTNGENNGTKNATGVDPNTNIIINEGATALNVYGAGYGTDATVSGNTYVQLNGGTVTEDIFGGGWSGNLYAQEAGNLGTATTPANMTGNLYTYVDINGGTVRNVYGGGYNGNVGNETTASDTRVKIGSDPATDFTAGIPAVQRSVYGGGYKGAVMGTALFRMYDGYVGYNYNNAGTDDPATTTINEKYEENLNYAGNTNNLLKENGNVFGGGFGEGATVDHTDVKLYGGIIRNSLYGGGEIASIGKGTAALTDGKPNGSFTYNRSGSTSIDMYGGLVINDVFGGGRGYAIDAYGNTQTGEVGYTDGYTFGTTYVNIHRGTIGTPYSVADGHGNVFGGGNIGYVYSTSGTKSNVDGYYYNSSSKLTEDCKVVISPNCKVTADVTVNGHAYEVGDYVPVEDLDMLIATAPEWGKMDDLGITIGNAVFAGGNVSAGSDRVYANAKTVFGNATASITDVFNKDFITVGDDGIGGLYGDGNLTFVDGYRELNITNYGTDYYNLDNELTYEQYLRLNDRERSYFELDYQTPEPRSYSFYKSLSPHNYTYEDGEGTPVTVTYRVNQKITTAQYDALSDAEKVNWVAGSVNYAKDAKISENDWSLLPEAWQSDWELFGFCTLYAGRMINTIQRADFCGVFGSRICLRGAQDRVTNVADYTNYTINRVKEVSLNQESSPAAPDDPALRHGNYFGIYSVVNYLGALTSDVDFQEGIRTTNNTDAGYKDGNYGTSTDTGLWANWKQEHLNDRKRNNGNSPNQVALASGVWLEILDESTENQPKDSNGNRPKIYGPITGVIELDLLNVATGEGGGYVYAKNVHGTRSETGSQQVTLTAANAGAISQKQYTYADAVQGQKMQSSGNFVHYTKRIVDDCYPQSGAYYDSGAAPAHYWYIRGEFYVYDQYISAYTGSAQAYAETVSIPLTITAEAQGKLQLESVDDNYYAYWSSDTDETFVKYKSQTTANAILVGGKTYVKNEPISYWDYIHLTTEEQGLFEKVTFVCSEDVSYSGGTYTAGDVILPGVYENLPTDTYICTQDFIENSTNYTKGQAIDATTYAGLNENIDNCKPVKDFFNVTNAISHDKGFLLTFDWDNPDVWNDYYHAEASANTVRKSNYHGEDGYVQSPTFRVDQSGVFGQQTYEAGDLIEKAVYDAEGTVQSNLPTGVSMPTGQATFEVAYIAKENCQFTVGSDEYNYVKGAPVAKSVYDTFGTNQSHFETGYICTETYQMSESEMIVSGEVMGATEYDNIDATYGPTMGDELRASLSPVYICKESGKWGGNVFVEGLNYEAIKYSNLSESERSKFHYNYDALDLLSENFASDGVTAMKYQGALGNYANQGVAITNQIPYTERQSIDYTATFDETSRDVHQTVTVKRGGTSQDVSVIQQGDVLSNIEYEKLTNEQFCYTPFVVAGSDSETKVYHIANEPFQVGDVYYNTGKTISDDVYDNMQDKTKVTNITKNTLPGHPTDASSKKYYFCTKEYTAVTAVTDQLTSTGYLVGDQVPVGTVINDGEGAGNYPSLVNYQKDFTIDGKVPTETSTLYVARETDIKDLSQDKIVTVVYWYEYIESDESGSSYETIRERHIVNVHVHFESGVPSIGELLPPSTVLPGTTVGLNQPSVSKGAYEILGGGWEMYTNSADATSHKNGVPYTNNSTKMYWYQDGYYVAYYAKSYLGKTYSNPVEFSVANYHRMNEVVSSTHKDPESGLNVNDYMYLDQAVKVGKRDPKIYINSDAELNNFADFFTETTTNTGLTNVKDAQNLNFFLQADIDHSGTWTPVGTSTDCFQGTFNGDGHTISGLDNSLFGYLCNNVYNLGVTGSFTGGGVADTGDGYVENCWVATTGTPATATLAVFGNPTRDSGTQIVNCYYPETNSGYATTPTTHGVATIKPVKSFINGEVAYDLNGFYLNKRYHDANTNSGNDYSYWTLNSDRTDKNAEAQTGHYPDGVNKYVENYYSDGDFRYSNGLIPMNQNIRENNLKQFFPIYPDDYIFFGQKLTYATATQDNHPEAIIKEVAETANDDDNRFIDMENTGNRVFRAPAYYRSKTMDVAHFNSNAAFSATYTVPAGLYTSADATYDTYKGMTAIDFTGNGDTTWAAGFDTNGIFNKKVLDYVGLTGFRTDGITQNLLAYIPAATGNANDPESMTNSVLNNYFHEPEFTISDANYNNVAKINSSDVASVKGHVVQKNGSYVAHGNHFLVDKQDFNAPIEYNFADGKRMWYQREPLHFVEAVEGAWETIVLPFTATLVSAHQKGAISHFYGGSSVGHEYWLRGFDSIDDTNKGIFTRPAAGSGAYNYANHFLWDYYFSKEPQAGFEAGSDANEDEYQKYYSPDNELNFSDYGYLEGGVPYIVAFPGSRFYEFDMSGQFLPQNTDPDANIAQLAKQTVTYASATGATIGVSDDLTGHLTITKTKNGKDYNFKGTFLNTEIAANKGYKLNVVTDPNASAAEKAESGKQFDLQTSAFTMEPFRAYFDFAASSSSVKAEQDYILIGTRGGTETPGVDENDPGLGETGDLVIYGKRGAIVTSSTMKEAVNVSVTSAAGIVVANFELQPGETRITPVHSTGVYIVNNKKISVK